MKPILRYFLLATVLGALTVPLCIQAAAPGSLDPTFAGSGMSLVGFPGGDQFAYASTVQGDGKLVLAGGCVVGNFDEFEIVRLGTNNAPDPSFGAGGVVLTPFSPESIVAGGAGAMALKIQGDGKIVAAGWADSAGLYGDFALARYNADGSLDTGFGEGGRVVTSFGVNAAVSALVVQGDGGIVVAGYADTNFALARYLTNGVLDTSFGSGGVVTTDVGGDGYMGANALLIVGGGNYLVAGGGQNGTAFAMLRYTTNGVLDSTFGSSGMVFTSIPGYTYSYATAIGYQGGNNTIQNPDKIILAGEASSSSPSSSRLVLARYSLNGALDASFGTGGIVTDTYVSGDPFASATAVLVQGVFTQPRKIVVAGFGGNYTVGYFGLARYTSAGALDTSFASGAGKLSLSFGSGSYDQPTAMTVQSGQLVLTGSSWLYSAYSGNSVLAAARFSASGVLDTSFGNNGVVTVDASANSIAFGVTVQPDGKLVLAGTSYNNVFDQFALARYNPDGTLDTNFGANGRTTTAIGPTNAVAYAVQVQPDGKIVAAGYSQVAMTTNNDFAVARYNANGTLDSAFGSGGLVITALGVGADSARGLAIQPDGKIVVVGSTQILFPPDNIVIVRYTTNGALDGSFNGGSGKLITTIAGGESAGQAVAIQRDGKIVVAGSAAVGPSTSFALLRVNADGSVDNSFGSFGRVSTSIGGANPSYAYALALQSDGKIVVAGVAEFGQTGVMALCRYLTNGMLDASFGTGGVVTNQVGFIYDTANSVAILPNGKIIAGGYSYQGSFINYALVRYTASGSLDPSYGIGGEVIVNFQDGYDDGYGLALDQIGRAVIVGGANNLFGIARLASEPYLQITSINQLANGQTMLEGLGVPQASHTLHDAPQPISGQFNSLDNVTPDNGGFWQYLDVTTPGVNSRFYRLSYP